MEDMGHGRKGQRLDLRWVRQMVEKYLRNLSFVLGLSLDRSPVGSVGSRHVTI